MDYPIAKDRSDMARNKDTIKALEIRFAHCIARGMTQADAYRTIKPRSKKWPNQNVAEAASTYAAKQSVKDEVKNAIRAMQMTEIHTSAEWMQTTLMLLEKAQTEGNLNAAQALNRQLGQATGALSNNVSVNIYDTMDDAALIERLTKDNKGLGAQLTKLLGRQSFDA